MSRKKVWKKWGALVIGTALIGGLAACGSTASDASDAANSQSGAAASGEQQSTESEAGDYESIQKPESISWCSHDGLLPENGQTEFDAEYERLTGIKLEHTYVTGNEYNEKIELDYAADTVPDVFDLSSTYFPRYAAEGALADLTDLVKESGLYDLVDEAIWERHIFSHCKSSVPR